MRRNRIILAILWILSLVAISFYGGCISYGFFAFFTLLPVISIVYLFFVYLFFKIYQNLDGRHLTCDHASGFYYTLQNESFFAFSGVRVIFYSTFSSITGLDDAPEYELMPHTGIRKKTDIICRYRGEYEVGIKKVVIEDFLRLFSFTYMNKEPLRVTVRPNILNLEQVKKGEFLMNSTHEMMHNKSEPDLLLREYAAGDDPRFINWKVSGALNKLMVRQETGAQQDGISIIMDPKRYSSKKEDYLPLENKIMEAVIALALYYSKRKIPVSVYYTEGGMKKCDVDEKGFEDFYESMSYFAFTGDNEPEILLDEVLSKGEIFLSRAAFFVLHKWDIASMEAARRISENNVPVVVYLISDEDEPLGADIPRCLVCRIRTDADLFEVM